MGGNLYFLIGGIGMYLAGPEAILAALKSAADGILREVLTQFTTMLFRGLHAEVLMTTSVQCHRCQDRRFVGAGLLSMAQALGLIYGPAVASQRAVCPFGGAQ